MAVVRINTQDFCCDYDYKEKVCVDITEFDNTFVIKGNPHFKETKSAEWYVEVVTMLNELDCYYDSFDDWSDVYTYLTEEKKLAIKELYDKCRCVEDIYIPVLNVIYPNRKYVEHTMRGYCQREWQNVIYDANAVTDEMIETLEAFYMGKIAELYYEDFCQIDYVTDDELWKAEREDNLEQLIRERFQEIDAEEEVEIYKSNGTITMIKWEKVS